MSELDWTLLLWHHFDQEPRTELAVGRERRLWDRTRVDILTNRWACEVDWAHKWAEAVGQAIWYSINTSRKPYIILLCKDMDYDARAIYRCRAVCERLKIKMDLVDCRKRLLLTDGAVVFLGGEDNE
ncbi:MAG: hypothetical protein ACYTEQ_24220 [Planctomycetota bacterium]|jgi:hypothetical protein